MLYVMSKPTLRPFMMKITSYIPSQWITLGIIQSEFDPLFENNALCCNILEDVIRYKMKEKYFFQRTASKTG